MGGVATPVVISGQSKLFRDNQSYSGTIWAKAVFRDPFGTLPGPFRDTGKKFGTVPEIPGQLATMCIERSNISPLDRPLSAQCLNSI